MSEMKIEYTSEKEINFWPRFPGNAQLLAQEMLDSCLKTQWQSEEEIHKGQMAQLNMLLGYAQLNSSYYGRLLSKINTNKNDDLSKVWEQIPPLKLSEIVQNGEHLACEKIPAGHGEAQNYPIVVPDGMPVAALTTSLWFIMLTAWMARVYMDHGWDCSAMIIELRKGVHDGIRKVPGGWGIALQTGERYSAHIDIQKKNPFGWNQELKQNFYLMYDAEILPHVKDAVKRGELVNLKGSILYVRTPQDYLLCEQAKDDGLNVIPVIMYSGLGIIASPCPEMGNFHVNSEAVLFEEREGKSVLSILHNYALPLLKLECDLPLQISGECSCGRGAPTLEFIL